MIARNEVYGADKVLVPNADPILELQHVWNNDVFVHVLHRNIYNLSGTLSEIPYLHERCRPRASSLQDHS